MTVPGLAADRKVEKYAVANPGDVDGDGMDDIADPNPLNAVRAIAPEDGASRMSTTAEWNRFEFDLGVRMTFAAGTGFIKGVVHPGTRPSAYFVNASKHRSHLALRDKLNAPWRSAARLNLDRETGMAGTESDVVTYYFWFDSRDDASRLAATVPVLHGVLSANLPIMAAEATKWRLAYYVPDAYHLPGRNVPTKIKEFVAGYERAGITVLTDGSFAPEAPAISVSGGPAVTEGQAANFTFTADKAPKEDLTLKFTRGQCRGCDFRVSSLFGPSVTLPKGATTVDWNTATVNDAKPERHGWVSIALHWNGRKYIGGSPSHARVNVFDDDLAVSLSASPNPVDEGKPVNVEAKLTNAWSADATIPLVVTAGSAEAGDYAAPASIAIEKGKTSAAAALSTVADLDADDETLTVALDEANLPAGVAAGSPKSVTISIADLTPAVSLSVSGNPVEEGDSTDVEATLTKSWPSDLTIPLVVTAGSAEADDYAAPASVTVAKGETSGKAALSTAADLRTDDETLTVSLGSPLPPGLRPGVPSSVAVTVRDLDEPASPSPSPQPPPDPSPSPPPGPAPPGPSPPGPPPPPGPSPSPPGPSPSPGPSPRPPPGPPPQPPPPPGAQARADFVTQPACGAEPCRISAGQPVRFTGISSGTVRSRLWSFGDGATSRARAPAHAWPAPGFYDVSLTVNEGASESAARRAFLVEAARPAGSYVAGERVRCLGDSRFRATVSFVTGGGERRDATVVPAGTDDSGLFSFFDPANWEVLVKVLDGCEANGRVWVFAASTTNLETVVRVEDTVTGEVREYRNEPGDPAPAITDDKAFETACGETPG